jgi:hypothetical protein
MIKIESLWAMQHTIVPTVKAAREARRQIGRPNISLREAMNSMVTAQLKRYEVPIQKPSIAVPWRSVTIVAKEVIIIEASSDIITEIRAKESMISNSWVEGFQSVSTMVDLTFSRSPVDRPGGCSLSSAVAMAEDEALFS